MLKSEFASLFLNNNHHFSLRLFWGVVNNDQVRLEAPGKASGHWCSQPVIYSQKKKSSLDYGILFEILEGIKPESVVLSQGSSQECEALVVRSIFYQSKKLHRLSFAITLCDFCPLGGCIVIYLEKELFIKKIINPRK